MKLKEKNPSSFVPALLKAQDENMLFRYLFNFILYKISRLVITLDVLLFSLCMKIIDLPEITLHTTRIILPRMI